MPSSLFFIGCQAGLLGNGLNYHLGFQKHSKANLDLDLQNAVAPSVSFLLQTLGNGHRIVGNYKAMANSLLHASTCILWG